MRVAVGADHGGYRMKEMIRVLVSELGHQVVDLGCFSPDSVDYPDVAGKVAEQVDSGEVDRGILVCGTGIGMSMVANRYAGVRAALCHDHYTARLSREHNNANVLCVGERVIGPGVAEEIVRIWLQTDFSGGRHLGRIEKFSSC